MSVRKRPPVRSTAAAYFDVELTQHEQSEAIDAIMDATGFACSTVFVGTFRDAEHAIEREFGIPRYNVTNSQRCIYACRQLGIDYRRFARNEPKVSAASFVELAKQKFPNFVLPSNEVIRGFQRQKLHCARIDWLDENCVCGGDFHTFCGDRFEEHDYDIIIADIAENNEQRKKLLHSIDVTPRGKSVKIANDALARIGIAGKAP